MTMALLINGRDTEIFHNLDLRFNSSRDNTNWNLHRCNWESCQAMKSLMGTPLRTRSLKTKTTLRMKLLIIMDLLTSGRGVEILRKLEVMMIGIMTLVLTQLKRQETTLLHTELLKTSHLSGMKIKSCQDQLSRLQETTVLNQWETVLFKDTKDLLEAVLLN